MDGISLSWITELVSGIVSFGLSGHHMFSVHLLASEMIDNLLCVSCHSTLSDLLASLAALDLQTFKFHYLFLRYLRFDVPA